MGKSLVITSDNTAYSGVTFGVQFSNGTAVVSETVPNKLGYTLDQLMDKFATETGKNIYTVKVLDEVNITPNVTAKKVKE